MNKYEITKRIENFAPLETAEKWDCVGFMVETDKIEISKIMLCLTPTNDVICQACEQNCDMIISHHPMFYVKWYDEQNFKCPPMDIYSVHTNLDKANGGTTDTLIEKLNLSCDVKKNEDEFLRFVQLKSPMVVEDFAKILSNFSKNLRYVNNKNIEKIKTVAFCAGSGAEFIDKVQNFGIDAFVTGDLKFHTALDSEIVVFDMGHFESEILVLPIFERFIDADVEIIYAKESSPFTTVHC